jgi:hypothetical protein
MPTISAGRSGFEARPGGEPERRALLDLKRQVAKLQSSLENVSTGNALVSGATLSGWWKYASQTTGPAATGQVRTSITGTINVGDTITVWLNTTDADGVDWSAVTIDVGDTLALRDTSGAALVGTVTAVPTANEADVQISHLVGQLPKKNARVQVTLVKAPAPLEPEGWVPWFTYEVGPSASVADFDVDLSGANGEPVPASGYTKIRWRGRAMMGSTLDQILLKLDTHTDYRIAMIRWGFDGTLDLDYENSSFTAMYAGATGGSQSSIISAEMDFIDTPTPVLTGHSWRKQGLSGNSFYQTYWGSVSDGGMVSAPTTFNFSTSANFTYVTLDFELYYP